MKLSKEEVLKIANLAKLKLSKQEITKFQLELSDILVFVSSLDEAETNRDYSSSSSDLENIFREDEVKVFSPEDREKMLSQSPYYNQGTIKVKRILN